MPKLRKADHGVGTFIDPLSREAAERAQKVYALVVGAEKAVHEGYVLTDDQRVRLTALAAGRVHGGSYPGSARLPGSDQLDALIAGAERVVKRGWVVLSTEQRDRLIAVYAA